MKLKILAAPILIVLIMWMAIWVVSPAFQELQAKKDELSKAQTKLSEIQEKNSRAAQLSQTLAAKSDQVGVLLRYIPEQQKEEEVIANLNSLAGAVGVSVYNISIGSLEKKTTPVAVTEPRSNFLVPDMSEGVVENAVEVPVKPEASTFQVELGVAGSYGKIKDLLGKVAALQRFNSIDALKIIKAQVQAGAADTGTSDNLQADISLNFNFINKNNAIVNLDNEIFNDGNFDMAVIDDIKKQMTTVVNGLTVGTSGVQNPFVR